MKIFISYSRRDADFAKQIDEYFQGSGHDVFTDVKDIQAGVVWTSAIENNISNCDIFVVIVTHASLRSLEVEKEVLQAQRENKKIIPSIHKDVDYNEIKWNLKSIQGIEFQDKYELSRVLYSKIAGKRKESPRPADDYITKRQRLSLKIIIPIISIIGVLSSVFLAFNFFDDLIESNVNTNNGNLSLNVQPGNTNNVSSLHIHNLHKTTTMNRSVNIQLIANDKDDNDDLNIIIVSKPTNGKLSNIDQATGFVTYIPNPGFTGTDDFTFKVNDKQKGDNNTGSVHITINQPLY